MNKRLHLLNVLVLGALFAMSWLIWPELPERVPAHFGADGAVTRWEQRSLADWLLVPLIAVGIAGLNYGAAALLPRWPGIFNHPDRDAFLALRPERRAPVIERMRGFLYGITTLTTALMGALQWMRYRTAGGADPAPYVAVVLVMGMMIAPLALGVWLPAISREIREQTRAEERDAGPGA